MPKGTFRLALGVLSLMLHVSSSQQIPAQAAAISKQCQAYTGTVCDGIVDYEYLAKDKNDDPETSVRDALKRVEVAWH